MQKSRFLIPLMLVVLLLSSCYHKMTPSRFRIVDSLTTSRPDTLARLDSVQLDSLYFVYTHHYHVGFNFVTRGKHLFLTRQQPEEIVTGLSVDSFAVDKGKHLVVADVRILSTDPVDSVWVQVATEDSRFGWVHERRLLHEVDPDDPISQFISFFSNVHLLVFLIVISIIAIVYAVIKLRRGRVKLVHFNDIDSFYPSLLALIVAASATFYASIQLFAPDQWRAFYFNPSLNPFSQPLLLEIFLVLVWAMPIAALAAIDDIWRKLDRVLPSFIWPVSLPFVPSTIYSSPFPLSTILAIRSSWPTSSMPCAAIGAILVSATIAATVVRNCVIKGVVPTVVRSINKLSNVSRRR